jgi:retron-type reverse transcriptase
LKKAFDTVNHKLLLDKLYSYGICNDNLQWFKSYLVSRSQTVNINSVLSDFKDIDIGIPQGSILGPLLFIIFVNSLPESVKCKCVMYADDTTLLISSSDPVVLQAELKINLDMIAAPIGFNLINSL